MKQSDEHIQQQIEAYLNQDMTDLDRSRFEKQIHDNPELHEEVELQDAVYTAIRNERKLILKAGLSQIPISLWSTGLLNLAKVAAITVGIGLTAVGGYYGFHKITDTKKGTQIVNNQATPAVIPNDISVDNSKSDGELPELNRSQIASDYEKSEYPAPGSTKAKKKIETVHKKVDGFQLNNSLKKEEISSEPIEPNIKSLQPLTGKDLANPVDGISNRTSVESIHPEVVIKNDNRNVFHYQFSDGKLILYADFSNNLYEVMELNQKGVRQIYFGYEEKFYPLNPNQFAITPLKEVKDKDLIQILKTYQSRRN